MKMPCCEKCIQYIDGESVCDYKKCKCHSPKESPYLEQSKSSKGQEGENVKGDADSREMVQCKPIHHSGRHDSTHADDVGISLQGSSPSSFEKQFPNLTAYDRKVCPAFTEDSRVVPVMKVMQNCIDKAKVIEIIFKQISSPYLHRPFESYCPLCDKTCDKRTLFIILRDLGLDKLGEN